MFGPDPITVPADPPADRHAAARAVLDGQIGLLTRLAEIGMGIAEEAGRRATGAEDAGAAAQGAALTYARAARAVRMTLALQARLLKELMALDEAGDRARSLRAGAARRKVRRLIERAAEDGAWDDDAGEEGAGGDGDEPWSALAVEMEIKQLSADAWERLVDIDDADLADAPVAQIVARICRDLGLSPQQTALALAAAGGGEDAGPSVTTAAENDGDRPRADFAAAHALGALWGTQPQRPPAPA